MHRDRIRRFIRATAVLAFVLFSVSPAPGQEQAGAGKDQANTPGRFDFYVLALSWSPSYCARAKERAPERTPQAQCAGRPFAFVVHGLWPQHEHGYPSYCQRPAPRIAETAIDDMLDLMPSRSLVIHQWRRHGTCSGLDAQAYLAAVRKARAVVTIPPDYRTLAEPLTVAPEKVADDFIQANPGLSQAALAVSCDKTRLTEVRVCLTKDLAFRACPGVTHRTCRRDKVVMPAVRGG
jgi:ribonuclease T2